MRGDNLQTNGTISGINGSGIVGNNGLGVGDGNTYPYGMQWIYPCMTPRMLLALIYDTDGLFL